MPNRRQPNTRERDAGSGRFVPDGTERRKPGTTVVETMPKPKPKR
jgi:hypothetical protein